MEGRKILLSEGGEYARKPKYLQLPLRRRGGIGEKDRERCSRRKKVDNACGREDS